MTNVNSQIPNEIQNPNTNFAERQHEDDNDQDSQSPKTLTLLDRDLRIVDLHDLDAFDSNPDQHPDCEDTVVHDLTQELSADEAEIEISDAVPVVSSTASRRGSKRKKLGSKRRNAQERQLRKKLKVLVETLKPIPFVPSKALDFESHKILLQRLGLWDFVHIKFDTAIREDLVAQVIASYGQSTRCSYVNGCRINVSRADLARALKLPVKKSAVYVELAESVESIAFIEELVYTWMLLPDDMFVMTDDVFPYMILIKEGCFEKVDWAGLIWNMLEKELKEKKLENCYYASHLQQLIKTQHRELLEGVPEVVVEESKGKGVGEEVGVKDEEGEEEDEDANEEENGSGDVKMGGVDEFWAHELEENKIDLSMGQDNAARAEVEKEQQQVGVDQIMDFELAKKEHDTLFLYQKTNVGEPFLLPCHTSNEKDIDCGVMKVGERVEGQQQEKEEDADEVQHEVGFHPSPKCIPMEGMPSGSRFQAMDATQLPFDSGIDLLDNHEGHFLSSKDDGQMIDGSSLFGNGHKRDIGMDNHNSYLSLNSSNKRLISDIPWNSEPADMEMCFENMEHLMGKVRMLYAAKEQACIESTNNQQLLLSELQNRDNIIGHLHKVKMDNSHKIYRLEKELYMMTSVVEGYRKALKETQKAFAEYRASCSQVDEALYKDVPGSGGLVLTVKEFEKECLRKEEEEQMVMRDYENKFRDIEGAWISKLEGHLSSVQSLGNKLLAIRDEVKHLKEVISKLKVAGSPGCAPKK